jgi:hypothetical protein
MMATRTEQFEAAAQRQAMLMYYTLSEIAADLHRAANGGMRLAGQRDSIGRCKEEMRRLRDVANVPIEMILAAHKAQKEAPHESS